VNPTRSPEAGTLAAERAAVWRQVERRLAFGLSAAHITGAVTVFAFVGLVVPVPSDVAHNWGLLLVNLAVFVPFVIALAIVANLLGPRLFGPIEEWFVSGRAPDPRERALALRRPVALLKLTAGLWATGCVLFTAINAFESLRLAVLVAVTIAVGGLCTCALTYLVAERLGREVAAVALSSGVPEQATGPGVETRVLLAWALGAGIPLLGAVILAIAVLTGARVSANQVAGTVLFLGLVGLGFGLMSMRITARSIADPVEAVREAIRDVEAGDLRAEVAIYDGSEIGLLQAGFNRMAAGLRERERMRDLFGRHVGADVAQRALDRGIELGGEVRECAALFVDVVGSTELAATRPAPEVVELLNRFFAVVVEVVHASGGWVNKFEGDAALCVFGAPLAAEDAAAGALTAARELSGRLDREVRDVRAAVGVSFGQAVAGNIGAAERYEYTVIGDPVNEAARLCELAKERPSRVLASEAIVSAAGPTEASRWRLGGPATLRGRAEPTRLAEPAAA
jgi:adenylate cyclase